MTAYRQLHNPNYNCRNRKDNILTLRPRAINLEPAGWGTELDERLNFIFTYSWLGVTVKTYFGFDGRRRIALMPENPDYDGPLYERVIANDNAVQITGEARQLICRILATLNAPDYETPAEQRNLAVSEATEW